MSEKKPAQNKHMSTTTKVLIGVGAVAVVAVGAVLWATAVVNNYEEPERTTQTLIDESLKSREESLANQIAILANIYKQENGKYPSSIDNLSSTATEAAQELRDFSYRLNSDDSYTITYTDLNGKKVVINSDD